MTDETENPKDAGPKAAPASAARSLRTPLSILGLLVAIGLGLLVSSALTGGRDGEVGRFEDEAERLERILAVSSRQPQLLLDLVAARLGVGQGMVKEGARQTSPEVTRELRRAERAWSEYLAVVDEPELSAARAMAAAYVTLAEAAPDLARYKREMRKAADAAEIIEEIAPSPDSLVALAYYRDLAFEWRAADRAAARALELAPSRADFKEIRHALAEYRQAAREAETQMRAG